MKNNNKIWYTKSMSFWDWMNKENGRKNFGTAKRTFMGFVILLIIPALIYFLITWEPVLGFYAEGDSLTLNIYIIFGLWWAVSYFLYKRDGTKNRLNQLLDKLLDEGEEGAEYLFKIAKQQRQSLHGAKIKGEDRVRWFNIQ